MSGRELESLPPKHSKRYLELHLNKIRDLFWQAAKQDGITDYSPRNLARFDEVLSDIRMTFAEEGCPNPDLSTLWMAYAGVGSYFGDVLVHNLGGRWKYPNWFIAILGLTFGRPDWIYRRWFVVVGRRKVPVFVIAMRRHTRRLLRREIELKKSWDEFRVRGKLLTYPDWYWRTAAILFAVTAFLVFGVLIVAVVNVTSVPPPSQPGLAIGISAFFAALWFLPPWVAFIQFTKVGHEVTSTGIRKGSPWSRSFFARWDEVESVSYSYFWDSYIIRTAKGTIRMRAFLDGITFLLEMVSENVSPEKNREAFIRKRRYTI